MGGWLSIKPEHVAYMDPLMMLVGDWLLLKQLLGTRPET